VEHCLVMTTGDPVVEEELVQILGVQPLVAKIMAARGVKDASEGFAFLNPSLSELHDPLLMPDMVRARDRLGQAIENREKILVWGHEDTDGMSATALMVETITDLQGLVSYYIPSRQDEGHGLNKPGLHRASEDGVSVVVTVDCGVSDREQVEVARGLGMDVVIVDHHEVPEQIPRAVAVINPKRSDSDYPFRDLAGVGVAAKVSQALVTHRLALEASQWFRVKAPLLCLVMAGTVADRVSLVDENRVFVARGLDVLSQQDRPWMRSIPATTGQPFGANMQPCHVVQQIVPLLASAKSKDGRNPGCDLFLTKDDGEALKIASTLQSEALRWQAESRDVYERIARGIMSVSDPIVVVIDRDIPVYLLGYCASRLRERFSRPAVVVGMRGEIGVGEARGIDEFDLVDCFRSCQNLFTGYGGHRRAAGFSLEADRLPELEPCLLSYARDHLRLEELRSEIRVDGVIPLSQLNHEFIVQLQRLAPFGEGNPEPMLISRGITLGWSEGRYVAIDPIHPGDQVVLEWEPPQERWVGMEENAREVDIIYSIDASGRLTLRDVRPRNVS
jgi:single-stranded-DNA-specific exonuclease